MDAARVGDQVVYGCDPSETGVVRWAGDGELGIGMHNGLWLQAPASVVESVRDGLVVLRGRPIKVLCPAVSGTN